MTTLTRWLPYTLTILLIHLFYCNRVQAVPTLQNIPSLSTSDIKILVHSNNLKASDLARIAAQMSPKQMNTLIENEEMDTIETLAHYIPLACLLDPKTEAGTVKAFGQYMQDSTYTTRYQECLGGMVPVQNHVILPLSSESIGKISKLVPILPMNVINEATAYQKWIMAPYLSAEQICQLPYKTPDQEAELKLILSHINGEQIKNLVLNHKKLKISTSEADPVLRIFNFISTDGTMLNESIDTKAFYRPLDANGNRLAHFSAESGDVSLLQLIKEHRKLSIFHALTQENKKGQTPIEVAAKNLQFEFLRYFNTLNFFEPWLKTPRGKSWIEKDPLFEFFIESPFGKEYLEKPSETNKEQWMQWLNSDRGKLWLHSSKGLDWLKNNQTWLNTAAGKQWIEDLATFPQYDRHKYSAINQNIADARIEKLKNSNCFVISGSEKDYSGSFTDSNHTHQNTTYQHLEMQCMIVDWDELNQLLTSSDPQKRPPENSKILIIQAAHGFEGGGAVCNAGEVTGEEILKSLESYSQHYHVAAIIESCFSGDLMKRKLVDDANKINKEFLKKLCLVTSSYFGRISYLNELMDNPLKQAKMGDSIESLFGEIEPTDKGFHGMISSAAWSSVGITRYFQSKAIKDGFTALAHMRELLSPQNHCEILSQATPLLDACLDREWSGEAIEALYGSQRGPKNLGTSTGSPHVLYLQASKVPDFNVLDYFKDGLEGKETALQSIFGEKFFKSELYRDESPDCNRFGKLSSEQVLRDFMLASLNTQNYIDSDDTARRQACRDWTFEKTAPVGDQSGAATH